MTVMMSLSCFMRSAWGKRRLLLNSRASWECFALLCFLSTLLILLCLRMLCFALLCFLPCIKNLGLHISYFGILEMGSLLPGSWWWPLKGSSPHRLLGTKTVTLEKKAARFLLHVCCAKQRGSYVAHMLSVIRCWDWNPCTLAGLQQRNYIYSFFPQTDR